MKKYTAEELRHIWLDFFTKRGHVNIGSSSVIPENDPSVLFTTAGMHPLVPYLLGQPHPAGKRLCDVQKCIRTNDIDEVGDICHLTFFEMMGNWSLGDYFKKEMIATSFEFLTKVLNLPKERLGFTIFEGNELVPEDTEALEAWLACGVSRDRIALRPAEDNWWPAMENPGPCGPDSEMFYWIDDKTPAPKVFDPDDNRWVEIWNDVFMQFNHEGDKYVPLKQKNIDTGMGLERTLCVLNKENSVFDTPIFSPVIELAEKLSGKSYKEETLQPSFRILADHIRTSVFILGDDHGITPTNVGQGYILRRLIRRAVRHARKLGIEQGHLSDFAEIYINSLGDVYSELKTNKEKIVSELDREESKFMQTLEQGNKEFEKLISGIERKNQFLSANNPNYVPEKTISGKAAFRLFDTFGFPIEFTTEIAKERGFGVDENGYKEAYREHQELARTASAGQFKGGLADTGEETTKLHTACHLLLAGLRKMFGTGVEQKGSNITSERLRFDFNYDEKLTDEQIAELEKFVNSAIEKQIPVERLEMTFGEAKAKGGYGVHKANDSDMVSVYKIGDVDFQICGGPHVKNTKELGKFVITKEQSSSAGVRRIRAELK